MEGPEDIKARYISLAKKYNLPNWDALDKNFQLLLHPPAIEISDVLFLVYRRINDRLGNLINVLSLWINPQQHDMLAIKEHSFLSNVDKKDAIKIFTKVMTSLSYSWLDLTPKQQAEIIKKKYSVWISVKKDYKRLVKKIHGGWEKEHKRYKSKPEL